MFKNKIKPNKYHSRNNSATPHFIHELKANSQVSIVDMVQGPVEAVQIFDHVTGESEYAIMKKTDQSVLRQLGITLKNTLFLEKGRTSDFSREPNSRLISQIQSNNIEKRGLQIIYEENQDTPKQRIQYSIPWKIGDFDKQMEEIEETRSQEDKVIDVRYENLLIALLAGGVVPCLPLNYLKFLNIFPYGLVMHSCFQRDSLLTQTELFMQLANVLLSICGYVGFYFYPMNQIVMGSLLFILFNTNPNLQLFVLPFPCIINLF
ncbi:hypothetical protein pb186bvf_009905 [Paramecium bursaria]